VPCCAALAEAPEPHPNAPLLIRIFQIDNEDLTFSLETVIEKFRDDMAPYATGLCQQLAQQFWRITSSGEEAEGEDDDDGDGG